MVTDWLSRQVQHCVQLCGFTGSKHWAETKQKKVAEPISYNEVKKKTRRKVWEREEAVWPIKARTFFAQH